MTYHVPERNLERLKNEIAKLNKRATKLGVPLITITVGAFRDVPIPQDELAITPQRFMRIFEVEVVGETPKFAGWTFGATIEHTDEGNVLRKCPGIEVEMTSYRECRPACDHCRVNRYRRDTFVVLHDDGTLKQIGRNCLRDFLGHANPEVLAKQAELMLSLGELCSMSEDDDGFGRERGGSVDRRVSLLEFLGHVAQFALLHGFMTGKQARERSDAQGHPVPSTSGRAWDNMFPTREDIQAGRVIEITEQAKQLAQTAIDFVCEQFSETPRETLNDFQHNMLVIASCVSIEPRNSGLAAYLIAFYQRETERQATLAREQSQAAASAYFGELKKRYRNVTLKFVNSFELGESQWGIRSLHKFVDAAGNVFVWMTGNAVWNAAGQIAVMNEDLTMDFTVAEHKDFRGTKQTVITRCKVKPTPVTA